MISYFVVLCGSFLIEGVLLVWGNFCLWVFCLNFNFGVYNRIFCRGS